MLVLQANHIQKSYGAKTVLNDVRLLVYEGDKIGIVGDNGAGKTTLLNILSGDEAPDSGDVVSTWEAAYIRQEKERDPARSGGENAKADIRREAAHAGQVLFADEPTANLDEEGRKWVRDKLAEAGTLLLVSHDRALLDSVCTKIVALKDGVLTEYPGTYADYEAALALERRQHEVSLEQYRRKKAQLENATAQKRKKESHMRKEPSRFGNSEARLGRDKAKEKQKKVERSRKIIEARLERLPVVEELREPPALRIDFSLTDPPENRIVVSAEHLSFSYGGKCVLDDAAFAVPRGAKLALTGKNGAGKSTLLQLIDRRAPGITAAPKLRPGLLYQCFENLAPDRTVLENVMATSVQNQAAARSVLAGLLFRGDDVYKRVQVLSGGEKMRLSLAKLLLSDANALLLDEPTNYLDLRSLEAVERMLTQYPGTVLVVSHDARFRQAVTEGSLHLENGKITMEQEGR